MIKLKLDTLKEHLLVILLVLFFISESVNKIALFSWGETVFLARLIKGIALLYCVLCVIFSKKYLNQLLLILILGFLFLLGQLFISPNFNHKVSVVFIKYLFPLFLFIYFNLNKTPKAVINNVLYVFETIVFINSLAIIFGFIFELGFFKTYGELRFGYNGFMVSSASSTYFYSIALFYYFIKYGEKMFNNVWRLIVLISILLIGTKSILIVFIFTLMLYTIFYVSKKRKKLFAISLFASFIFFNYYLIFKHEIFSKIIQEQGFFASFTSLRSVIFLDKMLPFIESNWHFLNFLFGGINDLSTRPQMTLLDLFYFFGIIGSVLYLIIYLKNYFNFKVNKSEKLFFGMIFIVSIISGNFFLNATTVIYMLILKESIKIGSKQ